MTRLEVFTIAYYSTVGCNIISNNFNWKNILNSQKNLLTGRHLASVISEAQSDNFLSLLSLTYAQLSISAG